ncbi:MAG: DUF58 domain-containing protein [Bacillota bacterium]|jgi:uncharacterized protein (DUF58 family)
MIPVPGGRLIALFGIPLIFYGASFWWAPLLPLANCCNMLLLVLAGWDLLITVPNLRYALKVEKPPLFSIGRNNPLRVKLTNLSRMNQVLRVRLGLPNWVVDHTPTDLLTINGLTEKLLTLTLRPTRRGSFRVDYAYLRVASRYKWFVCDQKYRIDLTIEVYPDIKLLNHYLKLTKNNRDYKLGINRTRWMGTGTELESLRDYQKDDDSKTIDWKASTRLNRPISKVFQMESNNQVMIAVDCGRLMTAEQHGLSTLDHAVNSVLILAHIAFNAGDTVGIVAFSDHIRGALTQLKGRDSIKKITHFLTRLQPELVESNYELVFDYLEQSQKKRSLCIILTDMIDDINYELFKTRIAGLSRKHLVLLILLQDSLLAAHAKRVDYHPDDLYAITASREMMLHRNQAIAKLKHYKVNVLDVLPQELTGPLVNKYLELKTKNRL